jgi:hypothetical protein
MSRFFLFAKNYSPEISNIVGKSDDIRKKFHEKINFAFVKFRDYYSIVFYYKNNFVSFTARRRKIFTAKFAKFHVNL